MRRRAKTRAFTLAEVMISMAASVMIIGALLAGSTALQKALSGSELYSNSYADQRRLIDFVARDLRRAIGVEATDDAGALMPIAGRTVIVADRASLMLTLPPFYRSDVPSDTNFDRALEVVAHDGHVAYGTTAGPAPPVHVVFRKVFIAEERCVCFVREEAGMRTIIVRKAENLHVRVQVAQDCRSAIVEAWFRSPYFGVRPLVSTFDEVMLRNSPAEGIE